MTIKSCAFTGHRDIPESHLAPLTAQLDASLVALYGMGCRAFYAGGARGFDTLAAERVLAFRATRPGVTLHLILPCRDQMRGWHAADIARAGAVLSAADSTTYLREEYTPTVMAERNRALVAAADACLAYVHHSASGAAQTLRLAEKKGIPTVNLAARMPQNP